MGNKQAEHMACAKTLKRETALAMKRKTNIPMLPALAIW
jgi:hypothetical protein